MDRLRRPPHGPMPHSQQLLPQWAKSVEAGLAPAPNDYWGGPPAHRRPSMSARRPWRTLLERDVAEAGRRLFEGLSPD
jgi:hypothetical protein